MGKESKTNKNHKPLDNHTPRSQIKEITPQRTTEILNTRPIYTRVRQTSRPPSLPSPSCLQKVHGTAPETAAIPSPQPQPFPFPCPYPLPSPQSNYRCVPAVVETAIKPTFSFITGNNPTHQLYFSADRFNRAYGGRGKGKGEEERGEGN